jgi:hypothetical protein
VGLEGGRTVSTEIWAYKLKVGEALMQALQRCGEAMPVYASRVMPVLIRGSRPTGSTSRGSGPGEGGGEGPGVGGAERGEWRARAEALEEEGHFRASCLSGMADLMAWMGWSSRLYLTDVLDLVLSILTLDGRGGEGGGRVSNGGNGAESYQGRGKRKGGKGGEEDGGKDTGEDEAQGGQAGLEAAHRKAKVLVRRASAYLVLRLVRGLGPARLLPVLGLPALEACLRVLDRVRGWGEEDGVTRLHADRARAALDLALLEPVLDSLDPNGRVSALQALTERLERRRESGVLREVGGEGKGEDGAKDL